MKRSLIGLLAALGTPWWLWQFALLQSVGNAAAVSVCLLGLLYHRKTTAA